MLKLIHNNNKYKAGIGIAFYHQSDSPLKEKYGFNSKSKAKLSTKTQS